MGKHYKEMLLHAKEDVIREFKALRDKYIKDKLGLMPINEGGGGGGGMEVLGSSGVTFAPWMNASSQYYSTMSHFNNCNPPRKSATCKMGYYTTCSGAGFGDADQVQSEPEKKEKKEPFRLENLPSWKKEKMKKILHEFIKEYKYQKGVQNMTKGLKWLFYFLGFAILLNFPKILDIIAVAVGVN